MIIDRPHAADISALRQLWQQAFGDTDAFLDGFFQTGFSPNRCRCIKQDGQLAAALYWFDCRWEGKKLAYLYAVATNEYFRGQGLCRALMEDTHRHLKMLGYAGAVLVPGNKGLFALYKKLGYTPFCRMQTITIAAGEQPADIHPVSEDTYNLLRQQMLPASSVIQEQQTLDFAATFCQFYRGETALMCLSREDNTLYFQEYLGDSNLLPGIVKALGGQKGVVCLPGGSPIAMYHSLTHDKEMPAYLGIPLN